MNDQQDIAREQARTRRVIVVGFVILAAALIIPMFFGH
jgi:hypothetical protein